MTDTTHPAPTSVRFGRRQSRGLLLGFSAPRVLVIALAIAVLVPSMFLGGWLGAAVTGPVWLTLVASAFVPWGGRPAIETLPTAVHYGARHANPKFRGR